MLMTIIIIIIKIPSEVEVAPHYKLIRENIPEKKTISFEGRGLDFDSVIKVKNLPKLDAGGRGGVIWEIPKKKRCFSSSVRSSLYTALFTLFILFTSFTLLSPFAPLTLFVNAVCTFQTVLHCLKICMHAYIYCYDLLEYGFRSF